MFDPMKYGARCDVCPRRARYLAREFVPPAGNLRRAICVWLGQDPGDKETKLRTPFVGPTGTRITRVWDGECLEAGLDKPIPREEIFIINSMACQPIDKKSDAEFTGAAICCRPMVSWFLLLLHRIRPMTGILAMGKWAWFALTGKDTGMGKYQGFHVQFGSEVSPISEPEKLHEEACAAAEDYAAKHPAKEDPVDDEIPF